MPKYNYKCPNENCGKEYIEVRSTEDPQFYTKCGDCNSLFEFVSQESL